MIKKIAYTGQQAARFGIVMQLYIQQSSGNLVEHIQSNNFDKEEGLAKVKNVFSITTKCLDKIGQAVSFHHMSLVVRKPVFGVSDQVRHKPGCTATDDG